MVQQRQRKRRTSLRGRERELEEMWNGGLNDGQIARRVGCTADAIQHWRRRNDLPPNRDRGRPREEDWMIMDHGEWAGRRTRNEKQ